MHMTHQLTGFCAVWRIPVSLRLDAHHTNDKGERPLGHTARSAG